MNYIYTENEFDFCSAVDVFFPIQMQINSALSSINFGRICNYISAIKCTYINVLLFVTFSIRSLQISILLNKDRESKKCYTHDSSCSIDEMIQVGSFFWATLNKFMMLASWSLSSFP